MKKLSCCQNVVNVLLVHCLGGFVMIYVSGSGNIFAFGAGWVGHAMQKHHSTIQMADGFPGWWFYTWFYMIVVRSLSVLKCS